MHETGVFGDDKLRLSQYIECLGYCGLPYKIYNCFAQFIFKIFRFFPQSFHTGNQELETAIDGADPALCESAIALYWPTFRDEDTRGVQDYKLLPRIIPGSFQFVQPAIVLA